jgi:flagellar basal body rod protein FlgG
VPVLGTDGPITVGDGELRVDSDGSVWADQTKAGQLQIVNFDNPGQLSREPGSRLRADGLSATPLENARVRGGTLEQSNVSMSDRLAELTTLSRGFEALQKSISMLFNDVDGRAIDQLGRRP